MSTSSTGAGNPDHRQLRLIAALEATKGVLAWAAALGLHLLGPEPLQRALSAAVRALHLPPNQGFSGWLAHALNPGALHLAVGLALLYGMLRLVEAWGLWRAKAWAMWFGVIGAAAYLPVEIAALLRHPHWLTLAVLLINGLIVWVLGRDLWRRRRAQG